MTIKYGKPILFDITKQYYITDTVHHFERAAACIIRVDIECQFLYVQRYLSLPSPVRNRSKKIVYSIIVLYAIIFFQNDIFQKCEKYVLIIN